MARAPDTHQEAVAGAGLIGLLAIQIIIGYEWLVSGITKLWRGGWGPCTICCVGPALSFNLAAAHSSP